MELIKYDRETDRYVIELDDDEMYQIRDSLLNSYPNSQDEKLGLEFDSYMWSLPVAGQDREGESV